MSAVGGLDLEYGWFTCTFHSLRIPEIREGELLNEHNMSEHHVTSKAQNSVGMCLKVCSSEPEPDNKGGIGKDPL